MLPSTENKIKQSVENWDNKHNDISFQKDHVWDRIQSNSVQKKTVSFSRFLVAASFLVLFIGTSVALFRISELTQSNEILSEHNNHLQIENDRLDLKIQQDVFNEKQSPQVIYQVKVEKQEVESESLRKAYQALEHRLQVSESQNRLLSEQIKQDITPDFQNEIRLLKDSLSTLQNNLDDMNAYFDQQLANCQKGRNKSYTIRVNEQELTAAQESTSYSQNISDRKGNLPKIRVFGRTTKHDDEDVKFSKMIKL